MTGISAQLLDNACETANVELEAKTSIEMAGMGTTLTVGLIFNNNLYLAHVGDTRVYLLRQGKLMQLTRDRTYVQMLVELNGEITREEAAVHRSAACLLKHWAFRSFRPIWMLPPCGQATNFCFVRTAFMMLSLPLKSKKFWQLAPDVKRAVSQFIELTLQRGAPDNVTVIIGFLDGGFKYDAKRRNDP